MKIGIIGAGQIGGTLTRRLTELGHEVYVANSRGPASLADLARQTGAKPVTVAEAARAGEVVVVTIPERKIQDLPKDLFAGVPEDVVVIDTGNYYPRERDGRIAEIEAGMTESGWVAHQLGRPVVKALNNIYARHLLERGRPAGSPGRTALPVAGDDKHAKETVMRLVNQLGFDAVDAGGLDESWRQQPGTPVYAADFDAEGVRRALAQASKERTPQWQATDDSPGSLRPRLTPLGSGKDCICDARRFVGMVGALGITSSDGTWNAAEGTRRRNGDGGVGDPEVLRLSHNGWMPNNEHLPVLLYRRV